MALLASSGELPDGTNALRTLAGAMSTKVVYGNECSISIARREAGYHSRPHYHESEQLNYVTEGQLWVFIENDGFIARAGDFFRVPANAVHWAFNNTDQPVSTFQVHAPPLEPERPAAHGLYRDDEVPEPRGHSRNIVVEDDRFRLVEERALRPAVGGSTGTSAAKSRRE
jgi:quercetin dioxygenase-like cupin family protein